jgi:hypothetical protein
MGLMLACFPSGRHQETKKPRDCHKYAQDLTRGQDGA